MNKDNTYYILVLFVLIFEWCEIDKASFSYNMSPYYVMVCPDPTKTTKSRDIMLGSRIASGKTEKNREIYVKRDQNRRK